MAVSQLLTWPLWKAANSSARTAVAWGPRAVSAWGLHCLCATHNSSEPCKLLLFCDMQTTLVCRRDIGVSWVKLRISLGWSCIRQACSWLLGTVWSYLSLKARCPQSSASGPPLGGMCSREKGGLLLQRRVLGGVASGG